jgi:hypothetical protein
VLRTALRLANGIGGATTGRLPPGRHSLTVTLRNPKTGIQDSASRRILIR